MLADGKTARFGGRELLRPACRPMHGEREGTLWSPEQTIQLNKMCIAAMALRGGSQVGRTCGCCGGCAGFMVLMLFAVMGTISQQISKDEVAFPTTDSTGFRDRNDLRSLQVCSE